MENEITKKSKILADDYRKTIYAYRDRSSSEMVKGLNQYAEEETPVLNAEDQLVQMVTSIAMDFHQVLIEWEDKSFPELGGLTPVQYYDSLDSIQDLLELLSFFMKRVEFKLPPKFELRIKGLDSNSISYLHDALSVMKPGDGDAFSEDQEAVLRMIEILALPEFTDGLLNFLDCLDYERHSKMIIKIMQIIQGIGKPALDQLIQAMERTGSSPDERMKLVYMAIIADIGKDNKSEWIYRLLKDQFRRSADKDKVMISDILTLYGDGRAVTAMREYVERNKRQLSKNNYLEFRSNIIMLGGSVGDLDRYFNIEKSDLEVD